MAECSGIPILKDLGIGSLLSLGWQLTFARGYLGAAFEPIFHAEQAARGEKPSETRQTIRQASGKSLDLMNYVIISMLTAAFVQKMTYGSWPWETSTWLWDYFFPRIGGKNLDGTDRRVSTPSFLRELPMLAAHIEEEGGGIMGTLAGARDMAFNKLMAQPFIDIYGNRDYYGTEIRDPGAPVIDQAWQFLTYLAEQQGVPIGTAGALRAIRTGGNASLEVPLSLMGFNPAPAYASRTALENRIGALYRQHVKPQSVPHDEGEKNAAKAEARTRVQVAVQSGDAHAEKIAREDLLTLHGKMYKDPLALYQFSRLPPSDQKSSWTACR